MSTPRPRKPDVALADSGTAWRHTPAQDHEDVSLADEMRTSMEEARVIVPGIQALFGFQLMVVFNRGFEHVDAPGRAVHLAALVLVAIAMALVMAPAAYHRMAERGQVSRRFVDLASRFIASALVPLMIGLSLDAWLVALVVTGSAVVAWMVGGALLAVFGVLWFVLPWHRRHHRQRDARDQRS
ncbi:MAG TPA: DUF6328 family protein [Casimicrobiaceae bacterium]|nr:DUF6328 family protein [Casimicrobiaceae bacterium]